MSGSTLYWGRRQNADIVKTIRTLDASVGANNSLGAHAATGTVRGIGVAVFKNRNQARDVLVLNQSQQVLSRTKSIIDTLHLFQQALRLAAHEKPTGDLHRPDAPAPIWGDRAQQLALHLDSYSAFVRQFIPWAPPLTRPQPGLAGATWLYFDRTPLVAALASLTRLEATVRRQAADALSQQAQKVGTHCGFDKIGAAAIADANAVAPGAVYKAQLFIAHAATSYQPTMTANGKALVVQPDGSAIVEFRVPPQRPSQPDTVRAWWHGTIKAHTYLADTTWQVNVPYLIIRKPAP